MAGGRIAEHGSGPPIERARDQDVEKAAALSK
jgi:hypothetical protein